jgi:hypothetical protein
MNKAELKKILEAEGYNPRVYSLEGGDPNERLVLSDERSQWCVYYSERGLRTDERCYRTEGEACEDFLDRIRGLPESESKFK